MFNQQYPKELYEYFEWRDQLEERKQAAKLAEQKQAAMENAKQKQVSCPSSSYEGQSQYSSYSTYPYGVSQQSSYSTYPYGVSQQSSHSPYPYGVSRQNSNSSSSTYPYGVLQHSSNSPYPYGVLPQSSYGGSTQSSYTQKSSEYGQYRDNSEYGQYRDDSEYQQYRDDSEYGQYRDGDKYGHYREGQHSTYVGDNPKYTQHLTNDNDAIIQSIFEQASYAKDNSKCVQSRENDSSMVVQPAQSIEVQPRYVGDNPKDTQLQENDSNAITQLASSIKVQSRYVGDNLQDTQSREKNNNIVVQSIQSWHVEDNRDTQTRKNNSSIVDFTRTNMLQSPTASEESSDDNQSNQPSKRENKHPRVLSPKRQNSQLKQWRQKLKRKYARILGRYSGIKSHIQGSPTSKKSMLQSLSHSPAIAKSLPRCSGHIQESYQPSAAGITRINQYSSLPTMTKSTLPPESVIAFLQSLNPNLVVDDELLAALPSLAVTLDNVHPYVEKSEKASMGSGKSLDTLSNFREETSLGSTSTSTLKSSITSDLLALWTSITSHPSVADLAALSSLASLLSTISPELAARLQLLIDEEKHELAEEAADAQYRTEEAKQAANERMMREATRAMGMVFGRMLEEMRANPRYAGIMADCAKLADQFSTEEAKVGVYEMGRAGEDVKYAKTLEELEQIDKAQKAAVNAVKQELNQAERKVWDKYEQAPSSMKDYYRKYGLYDANDAHRLKELQFIDNVKQKVLDCKSKADLDKLFASSDEKTKHCIIAAASGDIDMYHKLHGGDSKNFDSKLNEVEIAHPELYLQHSTNWKSGLEGMEKYVKEGGKEMSVSSEKEDVVASKRVREVMKVDDTYKIRFVDAKQRLNLESHVSQKPENPNHNHFAEKVSSKPFIESSRRRNKDLQPPSTPSL